MALDSFLTGIAAGCGAYLLRPDVRLSVVAGVLAMAKNLHALLQPSPTQKEP